MSKRKTPTLKEVKSRLEEYFKNPITEEQLTVILAEAEEKARCNRCGRMIFCGNINEICGDFECGLKNK